MASEITSDALVQRGLSYQEAEALTRRIDAFPPSLPPDQLWLRIAEEILSPGLPYAVHRYVHGEVFRHWGHEQGPVPAWVPSKATVEATNVFALMRAMGKDTYEEFYEWSVGDPAGFWDMLIGRLGILFKKRYSAVMDTTSGGEEPVWLAEAQLNIADSCFRGSADDVAIVYQRPGYEVARVTLGELESLTNRVANGLTRLGIRPGDAVAMDMPMTVEAVAIYLGIVRSGAAVVSIAESFAPEEIAVRLQITQPVLMFTQDVILRTGKCLPLYAKVVEAGAPKAVVVPDDGGLQVGLRDEDLAWTDFLSADEDFTSAARSPDEPTNILFSSGTTGEPKAVPWDHTTALRAAGDAYLHHDVQPGDVLCWPTSLGWMMGPWLVYASLVNRASMALFYDAPTGADFGSFVTEAGVTMLGLVPSLVRAWRASSCMGGLDWTRIKAFSSTGECSNADDMFYLMSLAGYKPIIEYCGGTEIGGGYITGTLVKPSAPGTFSTPALGTQFVILDENGNEADLGELFLMPPSMGLSRRLLNRDHHEVYYADCPMGPGEQALRRHGDQMERLPGGYYRAHGRADDTMNLGGIKVSSAQIERVVASSPAIHEAAAIAVAPPGGGPSMLVIYAVLAEGPTPSQDAILAAMQQQIREKLNPLFRVHDVIPVDCLPRTASNKVMRRVLRDDYVERTRGSE